MFFMSVISCFTFNSSPRVWEEIYFHIKFFLFGLLYNVWTFFSQLKPRHLKLTLILSTQSAVPDARMHESLAKAATAAGGSTVTRALASSAHFLCSGSDTVHHRIFLADM